MLWLFICCLKGVNIFFHVSYQYICIAWGRLSVCFLVDGVMGREPVTFNLWYRKKEENTSLFQGVVTSHPTNSKHTDSLSQANVSSFNVTRKRSMAL